jgi:bifunctional non-homologous end joining protein LigD
MAKLEEYTQKRNFSRTPEPRPKARRQQAFSYVVQKHAASRLHYDFRLELDGVLLSWAIPKGPSLDPSVKRLSMQTEDHPVEYGGFEGIIPRGEYGAGTVIVWDRGVWKPEGDPRRDYRAGRLTFELCGEKLRGHWHLVRTRRDPKGKSWLLFKSKDDAARPTNGRPEIVQEEPESVLTGRTIEEVAGEPDRVWHSKSERRPDQPWPSVETLPGARRRRLPARIKPLLAMRADRPPDGDGYLHELELVGERMQVRLDGGELQLIGHDAGDWGARLPSLVRALQALPVEQIWLDGCLVALDERGVSDPLELRRQVAAGDDAQLRYFAFDLLYLDGIDLRAVPVVERKRALLALLRSVGAEDGRLRYADHVQASGSEVLRSACKLGLEGIVSKRADSPYRSGVSNDWLASPCNPPARTRASRERARSTK